MAKKLSRAEKIRRFLRANPNMVLKDVAEKFDTTYQVVYMVRQEMRKREKFWAEHTPIPKLKPTKEYSYAWIDTNQLDESAKDALASQLITMEEPVSDPVNHPAHYKTGGIETIDFIEAKQFNYNMGNAVKYISRAEHKGNKKQDLEKAVWYINRELSRG
jgi:hypothetical protein